MPKKKNYPDWFFHWSQPSLPTKPRKPSKTKLIYETVECISVRYDERFNYELLRNKKVDFVMIESTDGYGNLEILLQNKKEVPDPDYERGLELYKKWLLEWEVDYKVQKKFREEWKSWKTKWDEEVTRENKKRDLRLLEQLKSKYDD